MTDIGSMAVDAVPERRVSRGDVEIAYWVHGEGVPLVMIMGLATPASSWGPLPALLAMSGYEVVVVENRDCGRSSRCSDEYTIADMASDVVAVMNDAAISSAYVIGISMGGSIAQELALSHPERVTRLMLISTGPGIFGGVAPESEVIVAMASTFDAPDPKAAVRTLQEILTGPGFTERNPDAMKMATERALASDIPADAFARQWTAVATFTSWDRLGSLTMPTLVLHGDSDRLVPVENGRRLAEKIPGSQLIVLEGVGHLAPLEAPGDVIQAITTFFPVDD